MARVTKLPRIERFEKMGFGMFIHFGLYSLMGKGEWVRDVYKIPAEEYEKLVNSFTVDKLNFDEIVKMAKNAGCRYITLTTRHHDGFSLYDTKGLTTFDAPHSACHRDLVREFVDACHKEGIVPFFYHTLIDWHHPMVKDGSYKEYFNYLQESIRILCTNYGPVGGFWFDGSWGLPKGVFEPDTLFKMIHSLQPEAMIINNTGMVDPGAKGNEEVDSRTFERSAYSDIAQTGKYLASEKCNILDCHWAYAKNDLDYQSLGSIIQDIMRTRSYNANYLLNVGPKGDGSIRTIDHGYFEEIGHWFSLNGEAFYNGKHSQIISSIPSAYVLDGNKVSYLCAEDIHMVADPNVAKGSSVSPALALSKVSKKVTSIRCLDNEEVVPFKQEKDKLTLTVPAFSYGNALPIRVLKINYSK
jgi:alpha-L-fucosidase